MVYIVLLIIVFVLYFYRKKAIDRKILLNKMATIYEKMEITVLNQNIAMDDTVLSFLKGHKNIIVNPEFADIDIILAFAKNKKRVASHKVSNENVPESLKKLSEDFKEHFITVVKLSMLKWSVIRVCLVCGTFAFIDYFFHFSTQFYKKINSKLGKTIKPNPYMSSILTGQNQDDITNLVF